MTKSRLEAFTDGVVAIVLRVIVLEIKIPNTSSFHSLGHPKYIISLYHQLYICCGDLGEPSSYISDGRTN